MKLRALSVRDNAIDAFLPPFFVRTVDEGVRAFGAALGDSQHRFVSHPDDYVLYSVGQFDDNSGLLEPAEPARLLSAREMLARIKDAGEALDPPPPGRPADRLIQG